MTRLILSIICNLIIVGGTGYTVWWYFNVDAKGQTAAEKWGIFRYYTYLSNVYSAIASAILLIMEIAQFSKGQADLPDWVMLLRFTGSSAVAVTFLTVIFFLAPTTGWKELYEKDGFYMHAVGPILAVFAFAVLEKDVAIHFPLSLLGAITVVIYAIVYLYEVLIKKEENGGWPDLYGFNAKPGMWKVSLPAMVLAACVISVLLAALHNL